MSQQLNVNSIFLSLCTLTTKDSFFDIFTYILRSNNLNILLNRKFFFLLTASQSKSSLCLSLCIVCLQLASINVKTFK